VEVAGAIGLAGALVGIGVFVAGQPSAKVLPQSAETAQSRNAARRRSRFVFAPSAGTHGAALRVGLTF
jgi:hypothetical protein